jgi:GDPmannose 4,6-dehydratase
MKRALITGITGQDGSYLAELLLEKGYEVHGLVRRVSQPNFSNLAAVLGRLKLRTGDMTDGGSIHRAIYEVLPDEIYNLAAMSQVRDSYDHPEVTQDVNAGGLLRIMEAVKTIGLECRIYQACSSEMFGRVVETPQTELTPFRPRSPYGASKVAAFNLARVWREAYGIDVRCGILFNHESPRRGEAFLSRKVCKAAAEFARGRTEKLRLGNLEAKRDWGYAKEYVEWIWAIMQHPEPDDFVIATGETYSVREFVAEAFANVGIVDWEACVQYDKALTRPAEVDLLRGDASKSRTVLGFEPKVKFGELVQIMVEAEMEKLQVLQTGATVMLHADDRRDLYSFPEAKLIVAKRDCVIGRHYHKRKTEKFLLSSGECVMHLLSREGGLKIAMELGTIYNVEPGQYHEFHLAKGSVLVGLNSHPYDPTDDYREKP